MAIKEVSEQRINEIRLKTPYGLPDNPSANGMSAEQVKRAFYGPLTDDDISVIAELNRVVMEANALFKRQEVLSDEGSPPEATGVLGKIYVDYMDGKVYMEVPLDGTSPDFHRIAFFEHLDALEKVLKAQDKELLEALLKKASAIELSAEGEQIDVDDASESRLCGLRIFGKTVQDGTPSPEAPLALESVGEGDTVCGRITDGVDREQTISFDTPNGLPGIPVPSGGNITDEQGQRWICDEIDFSRGVYVQRCKRVSFNGSENWYLYSSGVDQYTTFKNTSCFWYSQLTDKALGYGKSLCSHFRNANNEQAFSAVNARHGLFSDHINYPYIYFDWGAVGQTLEEWKAWLKAEYEAGMPLELIYALAEPVETILLEEEIQKYKALCTYKGRTILSALDNTKVKQYMVLTYTADTKSYIEKRGGNGEEGGFSPTLEVEQIKGGYRITVTDAAGTDAFDILNGKDGTNGKDGLSVYEIESVATSMNGYTLVEEQKISLPEGRTLSVGDLLLATKANTIYRVEVLNYSGASGLHATTELTKLSYTLTDKDKTDISDMVIAALPMAEGVGF